MGQARQEFRYSVNFDEAPDDIDMVGGKGLGLIRLVRSGVPTTPGFIVTTRAFAEFLRRSGLDKVVREVMESIDGKLSPEDGSRIIAERIVSAEIPAEIAEEVRILYRDLCRRAVESDLCRVAVRSSAVAEDLKEASFAGQHDTFLNVVGFENVIDSIKRCWASLFNARALVYRKAKNISEDKGLTMAVVIQLMVDPRSSGVTFTVNPLNNDPSVIVIESIWGLGEYLVRGVITPDRFVIDKKSLVVVERFIANKDRELVYDPESRGNVERKVPESMAREPSISDTEARNIASIALKLEELLGTPVDIEWAIDSRGNIYVVQVRPVTGLEKSEGKERGRKSVFKGLAASPGIAIGRAKVLRDISDAKAKGFSKGDVLVTTMTDPDWVPIMRIASAIVTERGGVTSHAAITARELGVPAVVGVQGIMEAISDGDLLKVDGFRGVVEVIDSQESQLNVGSTSNGAVSVSLGSVGLERSSGALEALYIPTATKIYMNLGEPEAIDRYLHLPFDGIGLMRIEFVISSWVGYHPVYLIKQGKQEFFVDKLASGISMVASKIAPRPVVVRFSDFKSNEYRKLVGGEDFEPEERNPMLGWRGASRYIHPLYEDAFRLELRAIKKVREEMGLKNVWVMVPMVRTLWEAERVISILSDEGLRSSRDFKIWAMAEIPSVALLIDKFSRYFDGFSIGSNDLTQMVLGIDRDSDLLSSMGYFDERDEAVLRAMRLIIRGAKKNGRTVSICGQAPSQYPEIVEFLVREGIDSISVNPDAVISTRRLVASVEKKLILESLESIGRKAKNNRKMKI